MFPPAPSSTFISPSIETAAPSPQASSGGLSSTTQHLLIAAGSIGSTILLVLVALSVYTMRKRDLTLLQAINHGKNKVTRRGPTPPPKSWDEKRLAPMEYGSMRKSPITPPQRAVSIARSTSSSSQRPLMALERSESFKNHAPKQPHAPQQGSFLLESPLPQRNASHRRNISETPSSPPLIIQTPQRSRSTSTHASRPVSSSSTLRYPPPPPIYSSLNPLPPPPTFKQFLTNRPSASHRTNPVGIASRFSWTNSNAPQTPHDASRDTAVPVVQRDSFMTQRSSVPRFRTIDSWVNQQADRIEVLKLKERFRASQSSNGTSVDERDLMLDVSAGVPGVPVIPTALVSADMGEKRPNRQDTRDTAPIFRQHPGTEVRFSTRSVVPSEVLEEVGGLGRVLE
ncbi:hypothetical protein M011DRAFT_407593 [Sporormia fimetaria CBS 119925]|uniref:Uncharacterized protein n=1 Tax=Sporormia fimetaria CBS 119925 TaxID=1340428 RepID=A0A6A6V4U8_9PLEO|nr:hypothetical protein M011DRAFT_407593 [Sporormia fimetaria CBS 119925]